jgi:hypothetical protein
VVNYSSLNGYTLLANLTGVSKEIINLIINTKYYFVITAVKDTFESSRSNEVTATPKAPVEVRMLNDTGVTWVGNAQTGNNTTCTGAVISAQDSSHGRDAKAVAGTLTNVGITICTTTISFYFPNQSCYIVSHARPFSAGTFCTSATYYPCCILNA